MSGGNSGSGSSGSGSSASGRYDDAMPWDDSSDYVPF